MRIAWVFLLILATSCGGSTTTSGPLAPFAPRRGVAQDVAQPEEPKLREATLGHAFPSAVLLYTENFDVKAGDPVVEQTRMALGGDERPGVKALLAATTTIATGLPDPTNQANALQILKVGDEEAVKAWISAVGLLEKDDKPVEGVELYGNNPAAIVGWMPEQELLMFGPPRLVRAAAKAAAGGDSLKSKIGSFMHVDETAKTMIVLNLPKLAPRFEPLVAAIHSEENNSKFEAHTASKPLVESLALGAANGRKVAEYLPKNTVLYASTATSPLAIMNAAGVKAEGIPPIVQEALKAAGGSMTLFGIASPTLELTMNKNDLDGLLFGLAIELKQGHGLDAAWLAKAKAELGEMADALAWTAILEGDRLIVAGGDEALMSDVKNALAGKDTLASEKKHSSVMAGLPAKAAAWLWVDGEWVAKAIMNAVPPQQRAVLAAMPAVPSAVAFNAVLGADKWSYDIDGQNVMAVAALAGVAAAIAVYSVRRYLATSKSAEAKTTVAAIARAAKARYENDRVLCASAQPVPADKPPAATKYAPSNTDYGGTERKGWKCLRFELTQPHRFRYNYEATRKSFVVVAEGDLDGDGVTSRISLGARVEQGKLVLDETMHIEKEFE